MLTARRSGRGGPSRSHWQTPPPLKRSELEGLEMEIGDEGKGELEFGENVKRRIFIFKTFGWEIGAKWLTLLAK